MTPIRPTPRPCVSLACAFAFTASATAFGQIGESSSALIARYGRPLIESADKAGVETRQYTNNGMAVTAEGWAGIALRVSYRKPRLSETDVQRLLVLNQGGSIWAEWRPPGKGATNDGVRFWLRADDRVMAALEPGVFTVTAGEWNRPPAIVETQSPSETVAPPPAIKPEVPPAIAEPPPSPVTPPRPKPKPPAVLPQSGDSKAESIQLLGSPRGFIVSGSREILQYEWGQVYLEQGKVVRIE